MRPIGDAPRRALLCASALLCAGGGILIPLAAQSSFEAGAGRGRFVQRFAVDAWQPPHVRAYPAPSIIRDPFALPRGTAAHDVSGMHVVQGASTGIAIPASSVRVSAIVTGDDTRALVEENGAVRVVRAGDKLAGSLVRDIGPTGVRLRNGTLIGIEREPQ